MKAAASGNYITSIFGILALIGVALTSLYSYVLFHTLAEAFIIVIACGVFMVAWNSRNFSQSSYFTFIGIAYLFVAMIELLHTMAYKGLGVFQGYDANLPTQLWIAARYMESLSLLVAPLIINRKLRIWPTLLGYMVVTALLVVSIFYWKNFPDCFVQGSGLTPFKVASEYIISIILAGAIYLLLRNRKQFDPRVLRLLIASIAVTICAEMAFTLYADVYGILNLFGHLLTIISFYLIYRAVIVTGLKEPYALLFRELNISRNELQLEKNRLENVNRELEDINRGVVALYAELDEKATHLASANELKARFLSNMSHEFRTPLNSILSLSRLLLDRVDGDLTEDQDKQVTYIQGSASALSNLVNDLLDISKIEAGKTTINVTDFEVSTILSALRGMLRPLLVNPRVAFTIEEVAGIPALHTDEGKVSQILRNLVSNAIKFTEKGEIRVIARLDTAGETVTFSVADTGIGIAAEDQKRIFNEYTQIDSALQRKTKGTGLGLSLSRKLAQILGGDIAVENKPGKGSVFYLTIPLHYPGPALPGADQQITAEDTTRYPVLVIEDDQTTQTLYEKYLRGTGFQVLKAFSLREARAMLEKIKPLAIVLDILLPGEDGWAFLSELKTGNATKNIPVIVATVLEDGRRGMMLGAEDFCTKPVERKWLLENLRKISAKTPVENVLIIDDEEVARYIIKGILADTKYKIIEADGGIEGLEKARQLKPDLILLDLMMPGMNGFEVLAKLKEDKATSRIPVIVVTSKVLEKDELDYLNKKARAVVAKGQTAGDAMMIAVREALVKAAAERNISGSAQ